jgi:carbon monoxide dehydrogenase subunit G
MIRCEVGLDVARSPSEVFAFVDDVGQAPRWLSRCQSIEQTSPLPKRVGTTLRYTYKEGAGPGVMEGAVTAYEKDRTLAMHYDDRMFGVDVSFRFAPQGTGTHIDHAVAITPKALMAKLMAPLIRGATRKQITGDTAMLKRLLESRS